MLIIFLLFLLQDNKNLLERIPKEAQKHNKVLLCTTTQPSAPSPRPPSSANIVFILPGKIYWFLFRESEKERLDWSLSIRAELLNQNLLRWGSAIYILNKIPNWFLSALMFENL